MADAMNYICHNRLAHHNVGTCLRHVSMQSAMFQRITQHAEGMSLRYGVIVDIASYPGMILYLCLGVLGGIVVVFWVVWSFLGWFW